MKHTLTIMISVLIMSAAATQAQTLNVAKQGDKAALFNFQGLGNLNLTEYQGGIGGKYFISDGLAIRAMLLLGVDDRTTSGTPEFTDNKLSFGLGGALEYHLPLSSSISPYVGGGISFGSAAETTNPGANKNSTTTFGIGALGGIEYFFNQNISLAAEYQFGITSSNTTTSGAPDQSELQIGFQTIGLTLAAYF